MLSVGRVAEEWAIARPAVARGYQLRPDDADLCHLCQEVRQVLREQYPDLLMQSQHDQEASLGR